MKIMNYFIFILVFYFSMMPAFAYLDNRYIHSHSHLHFVITDVRFQEIKNKSAALPNQKLKLIVCSVTPKNMSKVKMISKNMLCEGGRFWDSYLYVSKLMVENPVLVHRNEMVQLIARHGDVSVLISVIAKSDGKLNDSIKMYLPTSNQMIEAKVTGLNEAEVEL